MSKIKPVHLAGFVSLIYPSNRIPDLHEAQMNLLKSSPADTREDVVLLLRRYFKLCMVDFTVQDNPTDLELASHIKQAVMMAHNESGYADSQDNEVAREWLKIRARFISEDFEKPVIVPVRKSDFLHSFAQFLKERKEAAGRWFKKREAKSQDRPRHIH